MSIIHAAQVGSSNRLLILDSYTKYAFLSFNSENYETQLYLPFLSRIVNSQYNSNKENLGYQILVGSLMWEMKNKPAPFAFPLSFIISNYFFSIEFKFIYDEKCAPLYGFEKPLVAFAIGDEEVRPLHFSTWNRILKLCYMFCSQEVGWKINELLR